MKKNGFTLLEVLGVIVLLGVIALLVITLSNRILGKSKQSLYESQIETVINSAKKWTIANSNELPMRSEDPAYSLSFTKLAEDGYIDSDELINPTNNKKMCGYIEIIYNENNKQYKYTPKIIKEIKTTENCSEELAK